MPYCRTCTLARPAPQVFDAVRAAAVEVGLTAVQADKADGRLSFDEARGLGYKRRRFDVSVTDSGLGTTVIHVAWSPPGRAPWPLRSPGRKAARLCRLAGGALGVG